MGADWWNFMRKRSWLSNSKEIAHTQSLEIGTRFTWVVVVLAEEDRRNNTPSKIPTSEGIRSYLLSNQTFEDAKH